MVKKVNVQKGEIDIESVSVVTAFLVVLGFD